MYYFDQTASAKPYPEVVQHFTKLAGEIYANPAAAHRFGFHAEKIIRDAKHKLAQNLVVKPEELIFTSGATESINTALRGYLKANPHKGKDVITFAIEHKATLATCSYLAEEGYNIIYITPDTDYNFDLELFKQKLSSSTAIITFSLVNNEIGSILPIKEIVRLRNQLAPQAVIHVDAVQAWTKMPLSLQQTGVDLASFAGHKIHSFKGSGLLFVRKGIRIQPLILGGGQQNGLRSGTEDPLLTSSLALACELGTKNLRQNLQSVQKMKAYFLTKMAETNLDFHLNQSSQSSPYLVNLSFPGVKPETLLNALAEREIYVSSQSACGAKKTRSYVLDALPLSEEVRLSAIRISLDPEHKEQDIDVLVSALVEFVPKFKVR